MAVLQRQAGNPPPPVAAPGQANVREITSLLNKTDAREENKRQGVVFTSGNGTTYEHPYASFSGCDIKASIYVPGDLSDGLPLSDRFFHVGELSTLSITTHRGISPARFLGEPWVREHTRGTRTFAGTMVFSVLHTDVFQKVLTRYRSEPKNWGPYIQTADQIPPFTVTITAMNELGAFSSMAVLDVTLVNSGLTLSVENLFTETTYSYVAKWATPFMDGRIIDILHQLSSRSIRAYKRLSDL